MKKPFDIMPLIYLAIIAVLLAPSAKADNTTQDLVLVCTNGTAGASVAPWVSNCPVANQVYKIPTATDIVATDSKTGTWQPYGPLVAARLVRTCLAGSPLTGANCTQLATSPATTGAVFKAKGGSVTPPPPDPNSIIGKSISLTWAAPTTNVDGSALTTLTGYQISYSLAGGAYITYPSDLSPNLLTFALPLPPGAYCFQIRTIATDPDQNGAKIFSANSAPVCATLVAPVTPLPSPPLALAIVQPK